MADVIGLPKLQRKLEQLPTRLRNKAVRQALRKAAKQLADAEKSKSPVYSGPPREGRRSGTLKRSIIVRAIPGGGSPAVGVWIRKDAFYWRFLEFDTQTIKNQDFLKKTYEQESRSVQTKISIEIAKGIVEAMR